MVTTEGLPLFLIPSTLPQHITFQRLQGAEIKSIINFTFITKCKLKHNGKIQQFVSACVVAV